MFSFLSGVVLRRPWAVILAWLALISALYLFGPRWEDVTKDDDVRFFPPGSTSVIGQDLLERGFPRDASSSQLVLIYERKDRDVTPDDLRHVDDVASKLFQFATANPQLGIEKRPDTPSTPLIGPRLLGRDAQGIEHAALVIVKFQGTYLSKKTRVAVDRILEWLKNEGPRPPPGLELGRTGSAAVGRDTNAAATQSIKNTTYATIGLVVLILLIVYRSPLLAMIPLVTIVISVMVSLRLIACLTFVPGLGFKVINITQVFVIVVLFGAGTDYCLFLIARYCEELRHRKSRKDSLDEAISQVGAALVASAGTVIIGLGMLYFSSFAKVKYTGPTIALSLAVALLAALTLAPAMLALLGNIIFWPFRVPHLSAAAESGLEEGQTHRPAHGFWARVADLVVAQPLPILSVCLLVLLPLAVIGARTVSSYSQLSDLDTDTPSVIGTNTVRRYFAVGELSPAAALVHHPELDFRSPAGRETIATVSRMLLAIDNIAEVRSLTQPLGKPPATGRDSGLFNRITGQAVGLAAESRYVGTHPAADTDRNHITRLDLVFKTDPFSEDSLHALEEVQKTLQSASLPGGPLAGATSIGIAGSSSMLHDLKSVTGADQRRMYVLVTIGVYLILVALLRRPGICLYLIATVVLGYLASLGVTDLLFRALHHGSTPWIGLDWTVAFFLFVILVAVGEDYNIFLMARVIEEERDHGMIEGTRLAVAHTGGIISSCGLIMAGTFGSMLTGRLTSLRELGFALGLGVLLDTFLVRPILVPAFVVLVERIKTRSPARAHADKPALVTPAEHVS
jgi:putative drug exporter of the RND superfamily